jgi:hypothetical protein
VIRKGARNMAKRKAFVNEKTKRAGGSVSKTRHGDSRIDPQEVVVSQW